MAKRPVPILILTASPQDAEKVLEALEAGAVDFVQKPTALAHEQLHSIREELVEKVKAAAQAPTRALDRVTGTVAARPEGLGARGVERGHCGPGHFDGRAAGVAPAGAAIPADFPVPLVIVLHMPVGYTAMFAEKLAEQSRLSVKEAFEGCAIKGGEAWIAPAGRHLTFQRRAGGAAHAHLASSPANKPHCPSVDVLFQSAAEVFGRRVLGVVMTGMGDDGKHGAAWIKAQGGTILTEAEESCIIYGMPRSVVEAGLSDGAAPLTAMAEEITRRL